MLLEKGQIAAGCLGCHYVMWRPRYISILNMVHNCICLYIYIVYFRFCGAFVIFFCNFVFQRKCHIFGVLMEAARLVCTTENTMIADPRQWACGINAPGLFEMLSAVLVYFSPDILELLQPGELERSNTLATLKSYNSGVFVQIQSWTDQQVSRKKNKRCAIIQNELSLMSFYFVASKF